MRASLRSDWLRRPFCLMALAAAVQSTGRAENLPIVMDVEFQPLSAQVKRVIEALEMLGQPLDGSKKARLEQALDSTGGESAIRAIQNVLDELCLIGIEINPESRVKALQGPAQPRLVQNGWSVFLVKVHNEAGVTAELAAESPNAAPLYRRSTGRADPKSSIRPSRCHSALGRCRHVQRPPAQASSVGTEPRVPDHSDLQPGCRQDARRRSASTSARERRTWDSAATSTSSSTASPR